MLRLHAPELLEMDRLVATQCGAGAKMRGLGDEGKGERSHATDWSACCCCWRCLHKNEYEKLSTARDESRVKEAVSTPFRNSYQTLTSAHDPQMLV